MDKFQFTKNKLQNDQEFNKRFVNAVHIKSYQQNTFLTLTKNYGQVLISISSGHIGLYHSKKRTSLTARQVAQKLVTIALNRNIWRAVLFVIGTGYGRKGAIRKIVKRLRIAKIIDVTPIPYNGCRRKKTIHKNR